MRWPVLVLLLALTMGCTAGCTAKSHESSAPIQEYTMHGQVISLDPDNRIATIKHEEIKGWMGAMTMEYPVSEKPEFAKIHSGDRITATVYVQGDFYWIGQIRSER
jgi:protein SCO1/2